MSLVILGQSGGPTQLSANDDVFGLMTQVPSGAVKHSPGGLTDADGNSAYGASFTLLAYFEHATTAAEQITTVSLCTANSPYRFRVLGIKVRCIDSPSKEFKNGYGRVQVTLEDGDGSSVFTSLLPWTEVGDMDSGDTKEVSVVHQATSVIDVDEGLRCRLSSAANAAGTLPTVKFLVEVQCLRVL
jgi:hypothetical protein